MKNITEPSPQGYQVRIVRNRKEYSRYFAHNLWGGKRKALTAAKNWRDQMFAHLGDSHDLTKSLPQSNNTTTGVCGVSRSTRYDHRRCSYSVVYQASWKDKGKKKNRTFFVGTVEKATATDEFRAFRAAVRFRKDYEFCMKNKEPFNPKKYVDWKTAAYI